MRERLRNMSLEAGSSVPAKAFGLRHASICPVLALSPVYAGVNDGRSATRLIRNGWKPDIRTRFLRKLSDVPPAPHRGAKILICCAA
jgi:hypothetical protein